MARNITEELQKLSAGQADGDPGNWDLYALAADLILTLTRERDDARQQRQADLIDHGLREAALLERCESAEQLAVWVARKGVMVGHDECLRPCVWFDVHRGVEHDGTDADLLRALKEASGISHSTE